VWLYFFWKDDVSANQFAELFPGVFEPFAAHPDSAAAAAGYFDVFESGLLVFEVAFHADSFACFAAVWAFHSLWY
jgi:hypothetical protein